MIRTFSAAPHLDVTVDTATLEVVVRNPNGTKLVAGYWDGDRFVQLEGKLTGAGRVDVVESLRIELQN